MPPPSSQETARTGAIGKLAGACAVGLLACALSCVSWQGRPLRPVASLSDTTTASQAFERFRPAWVRNDPGDRVALRRSMDAFVEAFPKDGLTPLVRVYGALSLMDPPADWAQAERRLESLAPPPPGATHDLYVIAVAKLRRFHHQPDAAFSLLRPIVGKVVDARARGLLQEELTFDALEAHEPYEAIAYMDAWLRGASEEDRQASEAKVAVALGAVPEAALRGSLSAMRASAKQGESRGYGRVIQRLVAEQLGQLAVAHGDAALARWLLDDEAGGGAGQLLVGEDVSGGLAQLATSRRGVGSVAGRTVGLVLPTSSAALRDEVADVVRGVLWALEIGRDDATRGGKEDPTPIHLVTRDDGGDANRLRLGMEEVAGEGASVIITALDADSAREAEEWAVSSSIDVIVLAAPRRDDKPSGESAGFSVGEDWTAELGALAATLTSASGPSPRAPIAVLADSEISPSLRAFGGGGVASDGGRVAATWGAPVSCDLAPTRAGESRFPLATWHQVGVDRWLVAGSSACADDLLRGLARQRERGVTALSLEASDGRVAAAPGLRLVTATAGIVPVALADASDARVLDARAMVARTGAPAGWWTALGHDAALLARTAMAGLPADPTADAAEIARRRGLVHRALAAARAPLWTSEEDGFDASHVLPRTIRVVDVVTDGSRARP